MAAMLLANARCSAPRSPEMLRRRRGFTVIEMLVLGLILLLLLSIDRDGAVEVRRGECGEFPARGS